MTLLDKITSMEETMNHPETSQEAAEAYQCAVLEMRATHSSLLALAYQWRTQGIEASGSARAQVMCTLASDLLEQLGEMPYEEEGEEEGDAA